MRQGPDWAPQKRRALSCASLGKQRASGEGKRGMPPLFAPGLGAQGHIGKAMQYPHPFSFQSDIDDDMGFACRVIAAAGPFVSIWRRRQVKALKA